MPNVYARNGVGATARGVALLRWRPNQSLRRRRGRRQLDPGRAALPRTLVEARAQARPRDQVSRTRKARHVHADLGDDHPSNRLTDPGHRRQPVGGLAKRARLFRTRRLYARVATRTARAVLRLWGLRLVVHQDEPFPTGQVVYVSNHSSTIDLFVLVALGLPNTRFFLAGSLSAR